MIQYTIIYIRPDAKHVAYKAVFDDIRLAKDVLSNLKMMNCVIVETYNFSNK